MLFSIIIPVYNAKNSLNECALSILQQAFEDCEIILVDDGSTDGSSALCDSLAEKCPKIRVLHQNNKGPGVARNAGLAAAKGEYVLFADSDDFLEPGSLPALKGKILEHPEEPVFACRWRSNGIADSFLMGLEEEKRHSFAALKDCFSFFDEHYYAAAWKLTVKRSFLLENSIRFLPTRHAEDLYAVLRMLNAAGGFFSLNLLLYNYRASDTGTLSEMSPANALNWVRDFLLFAKAVEQEKCYDDETRRYIISYIALSDLQYYLTAADDSVKKQWLDLCNDENIGLISHADGRAVFAITASYKLGKECCYTVCRAIKKMRKY